MGKYVDEVKDRIELFNEMQGKITHEDELKNLNLEMKRTQLRIEKWQDEMNQTNINKGTYKTYIENEKRELEKLEKEKAKLESSVNKDNEKELRDKKSKFFTQTKMKFEKEIEVKRLEQKMSNVLPDTDIKNTHEAYNQLTDEISDLQEAISLCDSEKAKIAEEYNKEVQNINDILNENNTAKEPEEKTTKPEEEKKSENKETEKEEKEEKEPEEKTTKPEEEKESDSKEAEIEETKNSATLAEEKFFWVLDDAVEYLQKCKENGQNVYVDFNGHKLYSCDVTLDSAYTEVTGMTKKENDIIREKSLGKEPDNKAKIAEREKNISKFQAEIEKLEQQKKTESNPKVINYYNRKINQLKSQIVFENNIIKELEEPEIEEKPEIVDLEKVDNGSKVAEIFKAIGRAIRSIPSKFKNIFPKRKAENSEEINLANKASTDEWLEKLNKAAEEKIKDSEKSNPWKVNEEELGKDVEKIMKEDAETARESEGREPADD